jgi:predicted transposase YdaD
MLTNSIPHHCPFQSVEPPGYHSENVFKQVSPILDRSFPICYTCNRIEKIGVTHRVNNVATSPLVQTFPGGNEILRFFFQVIKLWEVPAEQLLQTGWSALLPLAPLAKGGKRSDIIQEMIDRLVSEKAFDLLAIAEVMGGLVFKEGTEREAFKRRFKMFQDILKESWVYQRIGQEFFAEGIEKGIEEGKKVGIKEGEKEGKLQALREMLLNVVKVRFPELHTMTEERVTSINNPEVLSAVNLQLVMAQTSEEARQILLTLNKNHQKH